MSAICTYAYLRNTYTHTDTDFINMHAGGIKCDGIGFGLHVVGIENMLKANKKGNSLAKKAQSFYKLEGIISKWASS